MHRSQTTLVRRAKRIAPYFPPAAPVARAIVRAGVTGTYHLHEHVLGNAASRRVFNRERPDLTPTQQELVSQLRRDGIAITDFSTLVGDEELWDELRADIGRFVDSVPNLRAERGESDIKDYLVRRHWNTDAAFPATSPWVRFTVSRAVLDVVNSYLGLRSKLLDIDHWYTFPVDPERGRRRSQRWHRDPEDRHLVKVFTYFSDVDESAGPFEYIRGSTPGGRYDDLWPWKPMAKSYYPPGDSLEKRIDDGMRHIATGRAGTIIFCNTSGFHRGGFATGSPRVMSIATYASPAGVASIARRTFRLDGAPDRSGLGEAAALALT